MTCDGLLDCTIGLADMLVTSHGRQSLACVGLLYPTNGLAGVLASGWHINIATRT